MQLFFLSLCELDRFSHAVHLPSQHACAYCHQSQYWVPHGFVYKRVSAKKCRIIGKRLFCSYRHGRAGCGRTRQLYLAQNLPRRHYPLSTLIHFILLLIKQLTVAQAYQHATGKSGEPRQAYRWLSALYAQIGTFRTLLGKKHRDQQLTPPFASHRLRLLLPTLRQFLHPSPLTVQYRFQLALL